MRAGAKFGHRAQIPFLGRREPVEADTEKTPVEVGERGSGGLRDVAVARSLPATEYVRDVVAGTRTDPVLSAHLKDGWSVVKPIEGYLQHDPESANWAAVIQWINPACPPPPERALR